MEEEEKHIVLAMDSMHLTPAMSYDKHQDELKGLVDCGTHDSGTGGVAIADQDLVVVVRGIIRQWKQIIGFYLTKGSGGTRIVRSMVDEAIRKLTELGFTVDALVLDQEPSQWAFCRSVGAKDGEPSIIGSDTFVLADVPHLLKSLRNNLLSKVIEFTWKGER